MVWRRVPLVALLLLLSCAQDSERMPDVVLVTIDTLRADRVGCYGYEQAQTPTLDRLAAAGHRYDQCQAPTPITLPSHASILTGKLPAAIGVRNNLTYRLPAQVPTLAEALAEAGYDTGAFVAALPLSKQYGLGRGFDHYDDTLPARASGLFDFGERPADEVVSAALAWLEDRPAEKPVFLWVHLFEPHKPYEPPSAYSRVGQHPYDGEVAVADAAVGHLLARLASQRGTTPLTVVTSDHGEGLGDHGEDTHAFFLYETTLRVPLIFHWPGHLQPRVVEEPVALIDIAPTVLSWLDLDASFLNSDGIALGQTEAPPRRDLLAETLAGMEAFGWAPYFALRRGPHKIIRSAKSLAFDLAADPHEWLALDIPADADLQALATEVDARITSLPQPGSGSSTRQPSASEAEALAALGYAGGVPEDNDGSRLLQAMDRLPDGQDKLEVFQAGSRAQELIGQENFEGARALLAPLVADNQENSWLLNLLGGSYWRLGQIEDAIVTFEASLRARPELLETQMNLARLYQGAGRRFEAAARYHDAAVQMAAGGSLDEAVKLNAQALRLDVAEPRFHRTHLEILERLELKGEVQKHLAQATQLFPEDEGFDSWLSRYPDVRTASPQE